MTDSDELKRLAADVARAEVVATYFGHAPPGKCEYCDRRRAEAAARQKSYRARLKNKSP